MSSSSANELLYLTVATSSSLKKRNCWRPKYNFVWVKNKGAFIVLMWNFLTVSVFHYMISPDGKHFLEKISFAKNYSIIPLALSTVLYPIIGWLADIHIGRYKTIRTSLWIMWIGILIYVICRITAKLSENAGEKLIFLEYFSIFIFFMLTLGFGGFLANIIQFGVDQLLDASAREISAFVIWIAGTTFGSGVLVHSLECLPNGYHILQPFLVVLNLSLALCIDFFFSNKYLVKEPVTQNPFRLIRKVLAYAIKHKRPRMRSAFTYWEDKLPSRIDFAKVKYGGPFTTEQVEDVKTFFRILAVITLGTTIISAIVITNLYIADLMSRHTEFFRSARVAKFSLEWYKMFIINHLATFSGAFWVLLYAFVLHPIFHKWIPKVVLLNKIMIGLLLVLLDIVVVIILNQVGRYNSIANHSSSNTSLGCVLISTSDSFTLNISYYWFAIPEFLFGLAMLVSVIGALEFICAQCPYSMKGLLIGTTYGMVGVMTLIEVLVIIIPFRLTAEYWKGDLFNCGFWMLMVVGSFVVVIIILFCVMRKRYKRRQREDVLPNEHVFANQYYSQLLKDH